MLLPWFISCNCHLFHQNSIIIIIHHIFWSLFSNCMLHATIVENINCQKFNSKSLVTFLELCYHRQLITLFERLYQKPLRHLGFENDMTILKYILLQYFQGNFKSLDDKLFPTNWFEIAWISVYKYLCWYISKINWFFILNWNRSTYFEKWST